MNSSQQNQTPSQPKKSGSNTALIIIIVAIVAVLVLGVGGYFAWKYYFKAKFSGTTKTTTTSSEQLSLKTLETTFQYPGGTLTSTDHSKSSGEVSTIVMETTDKLTIVYNYYIGLASQKSLTVSKKSLDSDTIHGSMTLQGKGYYVEIFLYQYDKTEIDVSIFGDNIKDDTTSTTTSTSTTTTTPTSTSTSDKTAISDDYVISDSDTRVITTAELTNFTPWQLKVARNEIYARHGREFVHKDLQCYFNAKSWYKIDPIFSETMLTQTENKNVATIKAYEEKINSPLQSTDSGC